MNNEAVSSKRMGKAMLVALTVASSALMLAAFAGPAQADVLKVTNKKDSGAGSLRAAIDNAAPRGDTIVFASGVRGTITLTSGDLDIDANLNIRGPGAGKLAVNGNNDDMVFDVYSGKSVRISGLAITEGSGYSGGGIDNGGNLTLTRCVVRNNFADSSGGGIYNTNVLNLIQSTVSGNFADNYGGGIRNLGTLTVSQSTVNGNRAAYGAGIYSSNSDPERATITSSTISGNSITSSNGVGGGIYNYDGLTEIRNSTITKNTAPAGNGGGVTSRGYGDTVAVSSSIVADNTGNAVQYSSGSNPFVSKGYNLVGSGNGVGAFNKTGDRTGVGAGLGSLANNGGPTQTHALLSGSLAINKGGSVCPATDQRGVNRPRGGACDIGAFEL